MSESCEVLVIGAGPGGYPAAIRAAQLGKKTVIVETKWIGGECLNWGCIPSKALISASNFYHRLTKEAEEMGIKVEGASVDVAKLQEWKQGVQDKLINGIKQLLKGNGAEVVMGTARFVSEKEVVVTKEDGSEVSYIFENAVISTGASFISLPGFQIDEETVISAKGALSLDHIPEELVCIGAGIIGMELGGVYAKLGSKVTFVELMDTPLPGVDKGMTRLVQRRLKKLGVEFYTESKATNMTRRDDGKLELTVETKKKGNITVTADKVLLSIGKRASTKDLGLDAAGVEVDERGFIKTNTKQQTNKSHIYAVGDCTGMPFLAHRATKQGIVAAEVIAGEPAESDWKAMPGAIFTEPEIAFAGLSEEEAVEQGFEVITGRANFGGSGRALTHQMGEGFVKVIADKKTNVILGVQIVGPEASDLIGEGTLAIEMGATVEDVGLTVHPHPTLSEMVMEAAEAALGKSVHVLTPKKR